jgi:hypothetical protein
VDYVVHIGLHKTGSTTIQRFLHDNAAAIAREAGALYPSEPGLLQHSGLTNAVARGDDDHVAAFLASALARARDAGANRIILSSEQLSMAKNRLLRRLQGLLAAHGEAAGVRIVVYFRNIHERTLSRMNQALKHNRWPVDPIKYRDSILTASPSAMIRQFESVFGEGSVDVRIFEHAAAAGLNRDFCAAAAIPWRDDYIQSAPSNVSPDFITSQMISLLRTEFDIPITFQPPAPTERLATPRIDAALLNDIPADAECFDLSHPLLAPHRELLTRRPAIDPDKAPDIDRFFDHLDGLMTALRAAAKRGTTRA